MQNSAMLSAPPSLRLLLEPGLYRPTCAPGGVKLARKGARYRAAADSALSPDKSQDPPTPICEPSHASPEKHGSHPVQRGQGQEQIIGSDPARFQQNIAGRRQREYDDACEEYGQGHEPSPQEVVRKQKRSAGTSNMPTSTAKAS